MPSRPIHRVLVTGGCGFLGRAVVPELAAAGYEVVVADNLSNPLSVPPPDFPFLEIDISVLENARDAFEGVDACIALASAWGAIGFAARQPADILEQNSRIALSTFRAAAEANAAQVVFVSTSLVYEKCTSFPTKESDLLTAPGPTAPFAVSKLLGETCCCAFAQQHGLPYTIIRPSNIYSAVEVASERIGDAHVIPDLFAKISSGQYPLELIGGGRQTRTFVHAHDLARGVVATVGNEAALGEDFNLSGDEDLPIVEVARMIWELCGRTEPFEVVETPGFPQDLARSYADNSKAKAVLGWAPAIAFRDGLADVVRALDEHAAGAR